LIPWFIHLFATADNEMDCEQLQALLPAYVEWEIMKQDCRAPAIQAHLAWCPDCAQESAGLQVMVALDAQGQLPERKDLLAPFEAAESAPGREAIAVLAVWSSGKQQNQQDERVPALSVGAQPLGCGWVCGSPRIFSEVHTDSDLPSRGG
jgi:hypothetical protein